MGEWRCLSCRILVRGCQSDRPMRAVRRVNPRDCPGPSPASVPALNSNRTFSSITSGCTTQPQPYTHLGFERPIWPLQPAQPDSLLNPAQPDPQAHSPHQLTHLSSARPLHNITSLISDPTQLPTEAISHPVLESDRLSQVASRLPSAPQQG
jgi:hypothetical protein